MIIWIGIINSNENVKFICENEWFSKINGSNTLYSPYYRLALNLMCWKELKI